MVPQSSSGLWESSETWTLCCHDNYIFEREMHDSYKLCMLTPIQMVEECEIFPIDTVQSCSTLKLQ